MASSVFVDEESANRALANLESVLGESLPEHFEDLFRASADSDLALTNLGRWLAATSNPQLHLQQLVSFPALARLLLTLFGGSQPITDSLIQNPELASLVLDPAELGRIPTCEIIVREGTSMLASANSMSHALDRLRFLKQRWMLPIVINDIAGNWPEAAVWQAFSDLAEALVELAARAVWESVVGTRDQGLGTASQASTPNPLLQDKPLGGGGKAEPSPASSQGEATQVPVMIVGFGKLGGRELNFSSDIDLAYVIPDGMDEQFERDATKFCQLFGRALSDRMGRGSLYRVDLRLRPYGNAGPLVASMRSFEAYYRLYAEQWEVQALIRSKPLCGPDDLKERWQAMRTERCFRPQMSEPELEGMLAMKTRIEERAEAGDIKRGAGGIRDVEFLVQALQLIHGHRYPSLQTAATLEALRELESHGFLDHAVATSLEQGYVFLRQVEHRCQLVGDQQTHSLPVDPEARLRLAKLMGHNEWREVESELEGHRRTIQTLYKTILQPEPSAGSDRDQLAERLGPLAPSVLQWFDSLPSAEAFYASLSENRDSLERVEKLAFCAPRLIADLKQSISLTEMLVSGEIEEEADLSRVINKLPLDCSLKSLADTYTRARTHMLVNWVLTQEIDIGKGLADLADALLTHCAKRLFVRFDFVALGSYGGCEMGLDSDADILFLVQRTEWQSEAETQAQQFLSLVSQLKRSGASIGVDLRLRPDGGKGMLVRSLEALGAYELSGMEMWERFALGQARFVHGSEEAVAIVRKVAYAQPLTPERLQELLAMKKRVETERVKPQYQRRDVKLGHGGLNDIEWLVHLHEMRYPTATQAVEGLSTTPARIQSLGRSSLLNAVEVEQVAACHRHLVEVRLRLGLLGYEKDILPENPDKLDRLAKSMSYDSGNDFLAQHERIIDSVRAIYLQGLERLKA